jgi:hypothetical protein
MRLKLLRVAARAAQLAGQPGEQERVRRLGLAAKAEVSGRGPTAPFFLVMDATAPEAACHRPSLPQLASSYQASLPATLAPRLV